VKADGTVVATGYNPYGQCEVSGWSDIVAVSAGSYHTVGLKSDGTVVAVGGRPPYTLREVSGWQLGTYSPPVSTPASSGWSLVLGSALGLGATWILLRRRWAVTPV
jgi:hypothetical protein